jgi:hypothetical protein
LASLIALDIQYSSLLYCACQFFAAGFLVKTCKTQQTKKNLPFSIFTTRCVEVANNESNKNIWHLFNTATTQPQPQPPHPLEKTKTTHCWVTPISLWKFFVMFNGVELRSTPRHSFSASPQTPTQRRRIHSINPLVRWSSTGAGWILMLLLAALLSAIEIGAIHFISSSYITQQDIDTYSGYPGQSACRFFLLLLFRNHQTEIWGFVLCVVQCEIIDGCCVVLC